jgi:restriction system protein
MARRKSLLEQILADRQRAKAFRERENQKVEARILREAQADQKARERARAAEERKAAQRERQAAVEERRQQQALEKAVAAEATRQRREAAERAGAERERASAEKERARAELADAVNVRNEVLRGRLAELTDVLTTRLREPATAPLVLEQVFNREGPKELCAKIHAALIASPHPSGVPAEADVLAYRPEARELIVERGLPRDSVIPAEQEFRIVSGGVRAVLRKQAEVRHLYGQLLARTVLRTLAEVFAATTATLVDSVVLNGRVTAVDKATGRLIKPHLVSVQVTREAFEDLQLDAPELDPELCLRAQGALISPHPHDLVPVKPLLYYDLDRFKTIASADFLVDIDSRLDLLTLTPNEFESLIRRLFEARGLKSWQTQASRDDGIDAVAVNEDPVLGGLAIIQAKRYSKVVGYESVTALAGVMHDKAAAKGILVTTSWVGKASRDFANRNGRMQIIEGRELKQMIAESLNMDVLISLPVIPTSWERAEIA